MSNVRIEYHLHVPVEEAREWLTDPEHLCQWWPTEAETDPQVGGAYELRWPAQEWTLRGHYLAVDADHVAFTWAWDHEDLPDRRVDIRFRPEGDGSVWIIDHEAADDDEGAGYIEGWHHFLSRLAAVA